MRAAGGVVLIAVLGACVEPAPELGSFEQASEVGDYETSTCTTSVVIELSRQIAAEVGCMAPGQLVVFAEEGALRFTGAAVLPYVSEAARRDLLAAAAEAASGEQLSITSAYRTVVQQYLLYRWFQLGRCGITAAAVPGNSNHESGRAIDVANHDAWIGRLAAHMWDQTVPGDPVHFDHAMSPDLRGTDVAAFQRLWNRNNPGDLIAEDGLWGPMTEARVKAAPAEGFLEGPMCAAEQLDVAVDALDWPRPLAPGETGEVVMTLRNSGVVAWPPDTALVTSPMGNPSAFAAPSWIAPEQVVDVGAVAPGASVTIAFEIIGPATPGEISETFALAAGAERWGLISLTVQVGGERGETSGGCGAGGGAGEGGWILLLALLPLAGRKRRFGT